MNVISTVLVANRGEIARRIFRTCREMGLRTVAVHSSADADAPFVREADEAVLIGGPAPSDSYLRIDAIIDAARRSGADAVHPGYGFLAENADFAAAVVDAGLVWIGPPPSAIETMGSKLAAKEIVEAAGVPTLPSIDLTDADDDRVLAAAAEIGYPVLVKASAGGGGKGMRIVEDEGSLLDAARGASREASSAFGDPTVFLEKYLTGPRHIEIQVFADTHGNTVSLHERECSIQRRHQKIVEEAPSPVIDADLREEMGRTAIAAAEAVGYVGAGTVEFLFQDGSFWFLEMNTRLQVEHPVTEMITGLDLVRLQIDVARGEPLPPDAVEPALNGHAIEVRLYAEDPLNDHLPVTGVLDRFEFPPSVRVDTGVESGSEITVHYDPMLAKVVSHAPSREMAAKQLADALRRAAIHGSTTNRELLVGILESDDYLEGNTDTGFLDRNPPADLVEVAPVEVVGRAAVVATLAEATTRTLPQLTTIPLGWRNNRSGLQKVSFHHGGDTVHVGYRLHPSVEVAVDDAEPALVSFRGENGRFGLEEDGHLRWFDVSRAGSVFHVSDGRHTVRLVEVDRFPDPDHESESGSLTAPMPGKVITVSVAVGDHVEEGATVAVLEAMKMEHTIRAPFSGEVTEVRVEAGEQVDADQILVIVDPSSDED